MLTMKKIFFLLIIASSCWQCKSGSNSTPVPLPVVQSKTELLTSRNWKLTAATVNPAFDYFGDKRQITNIYAGLAPCTLDDLYRYEKPNLFTITDGIIICPGNSQAGIFKWILSPNDSALTQVFGGSFADTHYIIESVSIDKLILTQTKTYSSTNYKFRFEYTKQ